MKEKLVNMIETLCTGLVIALCGVQFILIAGMAVSAIVNWIH